MKRSLRSEAQALVAQIEASRRHKVVTKMARSRRKRWERLSPEVRLERWEKHHAADPNCSYHIECARFQQGLAPIEGVDETPPAA